MLQPGSSILTRAFLNQLVDLQGCAVAVCIPIDSHGEVVTSII